MPFFVTLKNGTFINFAWITEKEEFERVLFFFFISFLFLIFGGKEGVAGRSILLFTSFNKRCPFSNISNTLTEMWGANQISNFFTIKSKSQCYCQKSICFKFVEVLNFTYVRDDKEIIVKSHKLAVSLYFLNFSKHGEMIFPILLRSLTPSSFNRRYAEACNFF